MSVTGGLLLAGFWLLCVVAQLVSLRRRARCVRLLNELQDDSYVAGFEAGYAKRAELDRRSR